MELITLSMTTLPPRSEIIVPVIAKGNLFNEKHFATEPMSASIPSGIIMANTLSTLSSNKKHCVVRLCNTNAIAVSIPEGLTIGIAAEVAIVEATCTKKTNKQMEQIIDDITIGSTNPEIRKKTIDLVWEFSDVFATEDTKLRHTNKVSYDLDTGNAAPVAQQKYRTPHFLREDMKKIIYKNVENGLMEPCSSPWAAPCLLVKKSNGSWRLVCDYRRLNNVTTTDSYPLPEINDLVTELSQSRVFSSTDLWSGFHQIPTTEKAKQKLAIITEFGQFTWRVMPMGGKNCPAHFQRLMDTCFRSMPKSAMVIYLDDFLCHSINETNNLQDLREMFQILRSNTLQIRADKTKLMMSEIEFCGHLISNGTKRPNPAKVEAVRMLQRPVCKKSAQSLFGLLNYHRYFIPRFAQKSTPITKSYCGKFNWTCEAEDALKLLKTEICNSALQLKIPNMKNANFVLETDASNDGYGACLFICKYENKIQHNHNAACLKPMEYMSKRFSPAQQAYYIQEKELYAGKEALRKWSHFLLGRKFQWRMDNACVKWAHRVKSSKLKISQWMAEISDFDIETVLKPSSQMKVSDCLSRQFAELNMLCVKKPELANLQQNDRILRDVRNYVTINRWPNQLSNEIKTYAKYRHNLVFGNSGELLFQSIDGLKTIPPSCIKQDILRAYHDKNGHPGISQTMEQLARKYLWPGLTEDVKVFVQSCHKCQITKPNLRPKRPPVGKSFTPNGPFEMIAFDLIGPLPITNNGNRFGLVGFDHFSKKVYAAPLQQKTAHAVVTEIKRFLYGNPQVPKYLLTDCGTEFNEVTRLCNDLHIKHKKSAPYHPETNGGVERANQSLKNRLFAQGDPASWDTRLHVIVHGMNISSNATTGVSPFAVETGYNGDNFHDPIQHHNSTRVDPLLMTNNARQRIIDEKTARLQQTNNESFQPFQVGELVIAKNMTTAKFPRFVDTVYEIIEIRGNGISYKLKELETNKHVIRCATQLKHYFQRFINTQEDSSGSSDESEIATNNSSSYDDDNDSWFMEPRNSGAIHNQERMILRSTTNPDITTINPQNLINQEDLMDLENQEDLVNQEELIGQEDLDQQDLNQDDLDQEDLDQEDSNQENLIAHEDLEQVELNQETLENQKDLINRADRLDQTDLEYPEHTANQSVLDMLLESDADESFFDTEESFSEMNRSTTTPQTNGDAVLINEPVVENNADNESLLNWMIPLKEFDSRTLTSLLDLHKISYKESYNKQKKMDKITEHFKKHFPSQPTTNKGQLLFRINWKCTEVALLSSLVLTELMGVARMYNLDVPKTHAEMKSAKMSKKDWLRTMNAQIRNKYPDHPVSSFDELLLKPEYIEQKVLKIESSNRNNI